MGVGQGRYANGNGRPVGNRKMNENRKHPDTKARTECYTGYFKATADRSETIVCMLYDIVNGFFMK